MPICQASQAPKPASVDLPNLQEEVNRSVLLRREAKQRKMLQSHFQILDKRGSALQSLPPGAVWPDSCLGTHLGRQDTEMPSELGLEPGHLSCCSDQGEKEAECPPAQRPLT